VSETGFAVLAQPPSRAEVRDVLRLAEALLSLCRRDVPAYARAADLGTATAVEIAFSSPASSARAAVAVLETVQLAVDAAAVAVEYIEETEYSGGEVDRAVMESLANTPLFELEIVELANGSIRGVFRLLKTRDGRGRVLNVALIASVVLSGLITAIPSLVVGVLIAANELTPDERDARIGALETQLSGVREELSDQLAANGELERRIEGLELLSAARAPMDADVVIRVDIAA